ncbi:hypothetical protein [Candidatus Poriferisodalis sp.]|uniref:hypothetical protein n=1 Tax=Candidatus Poriferisodalis sp. TaxID=3101277 RepID=UPI003D0CCFCD
MSYDLQSLRGDVSDGLAAAAITITPAATFGVVSGLGAASGIYGAIAVGLFVGAPVKITKPLTAIRD